MRALLWKELRELRWQLLLMGLLLALAQFGTLEKSTHSGSPMAAYQMLVVGIFPLMALWLANRLVVREYMGRTQLFLETLPINRAQVVAVKWLLGAALLLLPMALCLAVTAWAARGQVLITPHYLALVAIRSASFLLLFYGLAFAVGLTGRYRYLAWGVVLVGIVVAETQWQLAPAQWAPLALVQSSMVFQHLLLPVRAVLVTCGMVLGLLAATFALALSAQGSLVVALSRRMKPREKAGVTLAILALMAVIGMLDGRKPKPPFELQRATHSGHGPAVAVGAGAHHEGEQALADRLSGDLQQLQDYLALPQQPALSALPDGALDGDVFQRATLTRNDGVVLRAALNSEQFDRDGFRAFALSAWLDWYTLERASKEDRRWLLDGFAQWLVARDLPQRQETLTLRAAFAARVLKARHVSTGDTLHQWLSVREELGDCLGDALAWRMASALEAQIGAAQFKALNRALLAKRPSGGVRAALFDPALAQVLAPTPARDLAALARRIDGVMSAEQARLAQRPDALALPPASFKAVPMEGSAREVHYLVGKAGADVAPFSVRYVELEPWKGELAGESLARVDATRSGVLPSSFARGTRLFTAIERFEPSLGCTVRLAAQRWELP